MKRHLLITTAAAVVLGYAAAAAMADWFPGEPHKMHFPQMPDPFGWDVNATFPKVLADDWRCSETGPVTDVHVWGSWRQDIVAPIDRIHVSIHSNIPETPTSPSMPGELLWERDFDPTQFKVIDYGTGDQGWYDPNTGEWIRPDHSLFHQINIENIDAPFTQQVGEIYWLDISVTPATPSAQWGWKTSQDHFMDDAVWRDIIVGAGDNGTVGWQELRDPTTGESLDLAFVITPEPTTLMLLALGVLGVFGRRRH